MSNVFAVMVIPFTLLWNVRINWRQKLALSGIFSMTIFVIAFAIVRIMVANLDHAQADQVQLYLWSNAEMAMGMFIPPSQILVVFSYPKSPANH